MASNAADDFENDWTFVDRDGKVDIEVSLCRQFCPECAVLRNAFYTVCDKVICEYFSTKGN